MVAFDRGGGAEPDLLAWEVTRASVDFVLDTVQLSRGGGDLLSPLLFSAILEANLALVNRDRRLELAYAGLDAAAPDELRRPVSINAIAQSLRLPFETVRRRVGQLARSGSCMVTPQGIYVPNSVTTSPTYNALQVARHERLRSFYATLRVLGALPAAEPQGHPLQTAVRATNRAISEYMLRACDDLIGLTGDPLSSLVLVALARENSAHLPAATLAAWAQDPLSLSRPIRTVALAVRLNLPGETTRRHLVTLEAAGLCRRTRQGVVATAPPHAWPYLRQLIQGNLANVQRLFARLARLGSLAAWDGEERLRNLQ